MWEETVLLKIKRDFTQNEAVQRLLKIISDLELEIGILKSERDEAIDTLNKFRTLPTKTKKQWLQEEVFTDLKKENEILKNKNIENKKLFTEWRNKYFSLLAHTENVKTLPVS